MIEENFQAFRAKLEDFLAEDPLGALGVSVDQGADKIPALAPPGVLFVVTPTERMTGQRLMAGGGSYGSPNPKALLSRVTSFDVHIRTDDRTTTEDLLSLVANAIHAAAWGSYELKGGTWAGEDGSVNNRGAYYVLHGEMIIPIVRPAQSMVIGTEDAPLGVSTTEVLVQ